MRWWRPSRRTAEALERSERAAVNADATFALLASTVVRLHHTTRALEKALGEIDEHTE